MKTLILLLCATVLLWGCQSVDNKYITREEVDLRTQNIYADIETVKKDNSVTRRIVNEVNETLLKMNATPVEEDKKECIKEEDKKECVPFAPKIWWFAYMDITDAMQWDDFWLQRWRIINKDGRKYLQSVVVSYSVEGECVEHINKLWYDWIENI